MCFTLYLLNTDRNPLAWWGDLCFLGDGADTATVIAAIGFYIGCSKTCYTHEFASQPTEHTRLVSLYWENM